MGGREGGLLIVCVSEFVCVCVRKVVNCACKCVSEYFRGFAYVKRGKKGSAL